MLRCAYVLVFFFFNDTATTEIYTLSLHDALPICAHGRRHDERQVGAHGDPRPRRALRGGRAARHADDRQGARLPERDPRRRRRSEEHMSELQSRQYIVCRLLLEKKKNTRRTADVI